MALLSGSELNCLLHIRQNGGAIYRIRAGHWSAPANTEERFSDITIRKLLTRCLVQVTDYTEDKNPSGWS
mgnify:CR=1 FL=1